MRQRDTFQLFALVEVSVWEGCNVGVHTSLLAQCAHKVGAPCCPFGKYEAFEQRVGAVRKVYFFEQRRVGCRFVVVLLHHGRQLLVVANQDKLVDNLLSSVVCGKQTNDVRLKNLTCFVDNGKFEMLDAEDCRMGCEARRCTDDDAGRVDGLPDMLERGIRFHGIGEQIVGKSWVA